MIAGASACLTQVVAECGDLARHRTPDTCMPDMHDRRRNDERFCFTMRLRLKIWHRRHRYAIRQRPALNRFYRFGVGVVGTLMVMAGLVMIPLPIPGPGWVTFFLGLGVLSTEFEWAHRVIAFMRGLLHRVGEVTGHAAATARGWAARHLDYQSGVLYVRSWMEHQRRFQPAQLQLVAA